MCGRYSEHVVNMRDWMDVLADWAGQERQRRNIAPTQAVGVVTAAGTFDMRWGLVPAWSKTATSKYATFNARLENVADKPAFRDPWRRAQRCLIPAGGYYEWVIVNGRKQPHFVCRRDQGPVVFGGLWEHWQDRGTGESQYSCTILTKAPSPHLAELHHRMPVIIAHKHADHWLNGDTGTGLLLAEAANDEGLRYYPVSTRVNSGRVEDPALTDPVD